MRVEQLDLPGVLLISTEVWADARGAFTELHEASRYEQIGVPNRFVQDNHSRSVRGVLRGLHFQLRHPQGKLLSVVRGAIYDVVADVAPDSPTFGRWLAVRLAEGEGKQLWVPAGYAHGFCVESEVADVLYKCTDVYHPEDSFGVRWDDPRLSVRWPTSQPVLSPRDAALPLLGAMQPSELPRWSM